MFSMPAKHAVTGLILLLATIASVASNGKTHGENGVINDSPQARQIFVLSDIDHNYILSREEFHDVFRAFDLNSDGNITSSEFITNWIDRGLGDVHQALSLFLNLDVTKDIIIDEVNDMPYIFKFFDRNADNEINEGEFVIQWVKISI